MIEFYRFMIVDMDGTLIDQSEIRQAFYKSIIRIYFSCCSQV
jgi:beta-phosphoglucomutase-like phosphatase (HAD superfamily)